jgi:c-di-GMP phosphodiesterase
MHNTLHLARQPILDREETIIGYEFFYRNMYAECIIDDPRHATASVLVNLLNQIGSTTSFGEVYAFINTDGPLLLTDILRTLPKEKFVFELSSSMKPNARIHEAIRYYHSLGYRFALDNASFHPEYFDTFAPLFPYIEFAKFDVNQTDIEQFHLFPNPFGQMKLIAQKVEFYEMKEAYEELGFEYFQGFYFSHPHLITQRRVDPAYMDVMSLFSLLQNDPPIEEICEAFKTQGILSLQLFQFLRSVHPEYIEGIASIREMIKRFGKNALMQWLLLLIYSKSGTKAIDEKNSHAVFAQSRIYTMLSLLQKITAEPTQKLRDDIHLIAMLSLLEGLMDLPIEALLQHLNPSQEVSDALLIHTGILGRIYAATLKLESGDMSGAGILLKSYGISPEEINALNP